MNEKITLQDIINLLSEKQGINRKEAEALVRTIFDLIEEALTNEKYIKIKGLGTFKLTEVNSRESVNVNTGERFEIQGHSKISFTPDTTMKDLINKPFAHFETVVLNDGVELEDTPTEEVIEVPETVEETEVIVTETPSIAEETPVETEETTIEEVSTTEETEVPAMTKEEPTIVEEIPAIKEPIEEVVEETTPEQPEETPIAVEPEVEDQTEAEPVTETIPEENPVSIEVEPKVAQTEQDRKEKNINRILWGIIVALVLIILFGAYWMFLRPTDAPEPVPAQEVKEEVATLVSTTEVEPQEDTLKTVQFIELSAEELRKERVPSLADTLDYQIVGTQEEYTLQKGETIIRASVRFFGTKKYWPYIVKHNMDTLKDPDNIPAGVQLKIPKLVKKP